MDAREQNGSQPGWPAIKRSWEEQRTVESVKRNQWHGTLLPPIDSEPHRRPQQVQGGGMVEPAPNSFHNSYRKEFAEPEAKRPKYERNEYYTPSGDLSSLDLNGHRPHTRLSHAVFDTPPLASQDPLHMQSPTFSPQQRRESSGWEAVTDPQSTNHAPRPIQIAPREASNNNMCRHCKKVLSYPENVESVTQAAAAALTQLADTLGSGISSDQRLSCMSLGQREKAEACPKEYPPISQIGLRNTLNWLLGRIHHARNSEIMKRRLEPEADHLYGARVEAPDPALDVKIYENQGERQSISEDSSSMRSQYNYRPQQPDVPGARDRRNSRDQRDYRDPRVSIMNPPLVTLGRPLSSSPGRSIPSPTSINFPSPSASTFVGTSQPVNLPPPSSLQQSPINGYLPPIGSNRSDAAIQAHSAALQHEVSVQKIALSTLQSEHDKLLAAYLRSQTRASTLEKKQNVSDSEIISLSEEKSRLQEHNLELEKNIEDLTKCKEEYRQAAVQEGKQYVEIVKKASQLEMMAAKEREGWNVLKAELEQKVEALLKSSSSHHGVGLPGAITPNTCVSPEGPIPAFEALGTLTIETMVAPTSEPSSHNTSTKQSADIYRIRVLDEEVRRLKTRCVEMETALHAVRSECQSLGKLVETLGAAGQSMLDRANKALEASIVE